MKIQKLTTTRSSQYLLRRSGKKLTLPLFALLALPVFTWGQQGTGAAALEATGGGGSASATLGQVSYTSVTSSAGTVSQGIQQAYEIFTVGTDNFPEIRLSVSVFPNPATNHVTLAIEGATEGLSFMLTDAAGKQLQRAPLTDTTTAIELEAYTPGTYLLEVGGSQGVRKTFKIIKN